MANVLEGRNSILWSRWEQTGDNFAERGRDERLPFGRKLAGNLPGHCSQALPDGHGRSLQADRIRGIPHWGQTGDANARRGSQRGA